MPDPGNYRIDLWSQVGFPNGPDTWEDLRVGGRKIKEKFGNPVGIGFSQEMDSNMALRALLWSFGGAEQDEAGAAGPRSKETIEALKFARALYREAETPEVFTWDPSSNNRGDALRTRVLRPERDLGDAHRREGEPGDGAKDRSDAGSRAARSAGSRPST